MIINELVIRKAMPEDAKTLTDISFQAKRFWKYPEEYYKKWENELTITEDYIKCNIVYVALIKKSIVGYYSVIYNPKDQIFGKVLMKSGYWMEHIFIRPDYMKNKIGTKLIDHLKCLCKDFGIKKLTVFVDPNAKGFYEKTGATYKYMSDSNIENRKIPVFEFDFYSRP
jgi:maltose O-acetyltransferase